MINESDPIGFAFELLPEMALEFSHWSAGVLESWSNGKSHFRAQSDGQNVLHAQRILNLQDLKRMVAI
jgi:hypothetical protein